MINEVFYLLAPKMLLQDIRPMQGTFNCGNLVSGVGGSGDPRRKWESEKVLLLFAKRSKRTIEMHENVYTGCFF